MRVQDIILLNTPNPDLRLMLRMAKTLIRDAPAVKSEAVELALARLIDHVALVNNALARRLRRSNPHIVARELAFDRALDSLWGLLRARLGLSAQAYAHPGLDALSEARKAEIGLAKLRAHAVKAGSVHEQLFAAGGLNFTNYKFPAQAEAMAALLLIIEQDGLDEAIEQTAGAQLLRAISVCQAQYEEMVELRMRRESGVGENFRELRQRLRWLIGRYKSAVETLYDEYEPETEALVHDALRALVMVSALSTRPAGAGSEDELDTLVEDDDELAALVEQVDEFEDFDPGEELDQELALG